MSDDMAQLANIQIRSSMMGQDVVFMVTGGTAHIGATATAYKSEDCIVHTDVLCIPDHKEGPLAVELATMASLDLGCSVVVVVGIHLDQPSKPDIDNIVAEAKKRMRQLLDQGK